MSGRLHKRPGSAGFTPTQGSRDSGCEDELVRHMRLGSADCIPARRSAGPWCWRDGAVCLGGFTNSQVQQAVHQHRSHVSQAVKGQLVSPTYASYPLSSSLLPPAILLSQRAPWERVEGPGCYGLSPQQSGHASLGGDLK